MSASYTRALSFLEAAIERAQTTQSFRLQTVFELAKAASVAPLTMRKALKAFREKGILDIRHGSGIRVKSGAELAENDLPAPHRQGIERTKRLHWDNTAQRLEQDIARGQYRAGEPFPTISELTERYGVCFRTVRSALDNLERRGLVVRFKKRYGVAQLKIPSALAKVLLFVGVDSTGAVQRFTPRTEDILRNFERECSQTGLNLELIPVGSSLGEISDEFLQKREPIAGCACIALGIAATTLGALLRVLSRSHPVAILDETSGDTCSLATRLYPHTRSYTMAAGTFCGEQVGRYLLSLGHRDIAYISPFHANTWSVNRLGGLQKSCELYPGARVHTFLLEQDRSPWDFVNQSRSVAQTIYGALDTIAVHSKVDSDGTLSRTVTALKNIVDKMLESEAPLKALIPLFESALKVPQISAWVTAGDFEAVRALDFLRQAGCAVPTDISVIGFDNSSAAFARGLTSYDFNIPAYVHHMIRYLLTPGQRRFEMETIELDGFVNRRSTVVPPRKDR